MANETTTGNVLRTIINRYAERVRVDQRGPLTNTLNNIADIYDKTVQAADKKLKAQQWTPAGRELLMHEARAEAGAMIQLAVDAATRHHREHRHRLDAELSQVPTINEFRASEIRGLLRAMPKGDRDHYVMQSDDPELLASVVHGPRAFPLVSEDAVKRGMDGFNRAHRPQQVALRDDTDTFVSTVEGFAEDAQRHLRDALK